MSTKQYSSIFVPESKIDVANYLTELLICNYVKVRKKAMPTCPFWRKEYATDEFLQDLNEKYVLELIGIKDLLHVFDPEVLSKYIVDKFCISFKMLKKETQQAHFYELVRRQIKFSKETAKLKVTPVNKVEYAPSSSYNTTKGRASSLL